MRQRIETYTHSSIMKINPAPLHMAQAALIGLCAALSIAVLGTSAHTLDVFNKQQSFNPWWLPLWPQHFDVNGMKGLVGASTSVLVLCAVFLVFALVPRVSLLCNPTKKEKNKEVMI